MKINDLPKDRKKYLETVDRTLSGMPQGIGIREVITGYSLSYRLTFYGDPTDFYIDMDGLFVYWNTEEEANQVVRRDVIEKAFAAYSPAPDDGF